MDSSDASGVSDDVSVDSSDVSDDSDDVSVDSGDAPRDSGDVHANSGDVHDDSSDAPSAFQGRSAQKKDGAPLMSAICLRPSIFNHYYDNSAIIVVVGSSSCTNGLTISPFSSTRSIFAPSEANFPAKST